MFDVDNDDLIHGNWQAVAFAFTVNEVLGIQIMIRLKIMLAMTTIGLSLSPCSSWVFSISTPAGCFSSLSTLRRQGEPRRSSKVFRICALISGDASSPETQSEERNSGIRGVTLKIALDSTGAAADLAEDKSERFTCAESLDMVHRLRRESDAVLVGRNTIEVDNPSLTVRRGYAVERQPLRVILDPLLKLAARAEQYTVFTDGLPTIVYHSAPDVDESLLDLQESVQYVYIPDFDLTQIVAHLREEFGVQHLMVEGGPFTARVFLPLLDRVIVVRAPLCFKDPLPAGVTPAKLQEAGLEYLGSSDCGDDTIDYWSRPGLLWPSKTLGDWP
jgi:riboflavin-specific deaminase-like protein